MAARKRTSRLAKVKDLPSEGDHVQFSQDTCNWRAGVLDPNAVYEVFKARGAGFSVLIASGSNKGEYFFSRIDTWTVVKPALDGILWSGNR